MKTLPNEHPAIDQEDISKKIEDMLCVLEKRKQLLAKYYKSFVMSAKQNPEGFRHDKHDTTSE